jgi:hypothetical protein
MYTATSWKLPFRPGIIFRIEEVMAKKQPLILLFLTLLLGAACNDPIFYKISREVKPLEPRIKGVPTKFVVYQDKAKSDGFYMYVAAGSLHRYRNGGWDSGTWTRPPGKVFDLAATEGYLYALINPERPSVWRWDGSPTSEWEQLGGYSGSPQSIYGEIQPNGESVTTGGKVFVGARQGDPSEGGIDYLIYYVDEAPATSLEFALKPLSLGGKTGRLTGAAYNGTTHFISTYGRGVDAWDELSGTITPLGGGNLMGIISTASGKVFAFGRRTEIYEVGSACNLIKGSSSYYSTSAVALWRPDDASTTEDGKILLGIRDGSNYGYVELRVKLPSGELDSPNLHKPGYNLPSTVIDSSLFDTTIRPHPVNHIFQVPSSVDPAMVLFAAVQGTGSTTNDIDSGVWSYRERDGKWQWNAEE